MNFTRRLRILLAIPIVTVLIVLTVYLAQRPNGAEVGNHKGPEQPGKRVTVADIQEQTPDKRVREEVVDEPPMIPAAPDEGTFTKLYKNELERLEKGTAAKPVQHAFPLFHDVEKDKSRNPNGYKLTPSEKQRLEALLAKHRRLFLEADQFDTLVRLEVLARKEAGGDFRFFTYADYKKTMSEEVGKPKRKGDNHYAVDRVKGGVRLFTIEHDLYPEVHAAYTARHEAYNAADRAARVFFKSLMR